MKKLTTAAIAAASLMLYMGCSQNAGKTPPVVNNVEIVDPEGETPPILIGKTESPTGPVGFRLACTGVSPTIAIFLGPPPASARFLRLAALTPNGRITRFAEPFHSADTLGEGGPELWGRDVVNLVSALLRRGTIISNGHDNAVVDLNEQERQKLRRYLQQCRAGDLDVKGRSNR